MNSYVITGATSMIGRAITAEALKQGKHVAAVVRKNSPRISMLRELQDNNRLQIIECNSEDYNTLKLDRKYDAFLHLAWQKTDAASRDDIHTHSTNITYSIDAVYAAHRAGCTVFVFAGSQAEYGRVKEPMKSEMPCNPESAYGIAKFAAGKLAHLAASQLNMRCCCARILSTYGEGMSDGSLIMYLIKSLLAGEKPSLTKCEQIWDFMYVSDTARALLAITEHGTAGRAYPVGSGDAKTLREYVNSIRDLTNPAIKPIFGEKEYYPHQTMTLCADISDLQADTGFRPKISFEEGIKNTINWAKLQLQ